MPEPTIRHAERGDIPAISAIYRPAVLHGTATFEIDPPDEQEMLARFEAICGGGYPYLVAEYTGHVVGYAYAALYRTRPAYRWSVEDSVYVAPDSQGKGVGHALLAALITASEAKGFRQIIAVIGDSDQPASIALHRRAGFIFCGTIHAVGFKHGRWLDSVIMQRALGPGDSAPPSGI